MEFIPQLNSRHEQILWATVRHYVATAEPVGSRALTQEFDFNVSPATVRNAMGFLEKSGLLYQPHTSAGRVPSDSGYRLYVDRLMHPSVKLARRVDAQLAEEMDWVNWSLESLLRGVAQMLANLSGYLALVTLPQAQAAVIRHVQLVEVDPGQVLMVVLLDSLTTQSLVIRLPHMAAADQPSDDRRRELEVLSNFLTRHLRGCPLSDGLTIDWSDLSQEFYHYIDMVHQALADLGQRTKATAPAQLVISGLAEVLRQPEFSESQQVQSIVRLLEAEQKQLWPLFADATTSTTAALQTGSHNVRVWIGSENPLEPMQGCALVLSSYQVGETAVGRVGVLGPTRMMYENAVAVVEATAAHLSDALSEQAA